MRVNTVLLPLKEKRFNPLTQREELMPTGMLQEYAAGKPIGQPIKAPQMAPQGNAIPSSALRPQEGYATVTMHSPDTRGLAAHHARPGESVEAAAGRLADAADRFHLKGGRATAVPDFLMGGR